MMRSRPAPASRANSTSSAAKNGLETPFDTYQNTSPEIGCPKAVTYNHLVAVVTERDRPLAFGRPHPAQDRLQANAVLVGRPDLDRLARVLGPLLGDGLLQLFERLPLLGRGRGRMAGAGLLHRPADRLQGLPAALGQDRSKPEFARHPGRHFPARPQSAVRRWVQQTNLELLQQVGLQDGGARSIPAPQIAQSLRTPSVIASPQTLTWGAILSI